MNKKFSERGFTDQLYWLNFRCTWLFVAVCVIVTLLSGVLQISDLSLASYGIPAAFAELGVHTGYIIWKAKSENINKHPSIIDNQERTEVIGFDMGDMDYGEDDILDNK